MDSDQYAETLAANAIETTPLNEFLQEQFHDPLWLVEGIIPARGLTIVAGFPKSFKSMLMGQLALAVGSENQSFLGRETRHGPVILFQEEGARRQLNDRLACQANALGESGNGVHVAVHKRVRLDQDLGRLRDTCHALRPILAIFDPFAFMHQRNENSAAEMAPLMHDLVVLSHESQCSFALVHHVPKPQGDRPRSTVGFQIRGSSVLAGATDANLLVTRRGLELRLAGEFRDADALDMRLTFDPESLLLHPSNGPIEPALKVDPAELLQLVAERGSVTVADVATHFEVVAGTARPALENRVADGSLKVETLGRRLRRYSWGSEIRPVNDRSTPGTTDRSAGNPL